MSRGGPGAGVLRNGAALVLGCLLLAGCAAAARTGAAPVAAAPTVDWSDRDYTVACDGLGPGGFRAPPADGSALAPAAGGYEHFDIHVRATVRGDVDGDGAPDA